MRGKSGRVVLEIDTTTKRRLYSKLAVEGLTLKDWFIQKAEAYLANDEAEQLQLKPVRRQRVTKRSPVVE
jgi:hypothetical protein